MDADGFGLEFFPRTRTSATPPIEPLTTRPGVLLRLAGTCLLRCRAYPDTPPAAHSGTSNYRI